MKYKPVRDRCCKACQAAGEYNNQKLKGVEFIELQADEIRTGQKTTQLSGNLYGSGNPLVAFYVFESSGPG